MTQLSTSILAFTVLGIVFAIIFLFDGWKSSAAGIPFYATNRIRGLMYILGGAGIGAVAKVAGIQGGDAALNYFILSFGITLIACLFLLFLFVVSIWFFQFHGRIPRRHAVSHALDSYMHSLMEGLDAYRTDVARVSGQLDDTLVKDLQRHRDQAVTFITGIHYNLFGYIRDQKTLDFTNFLEVNLRTFAVFNFEEQEYLSRFRAAYFEHQSNAHQLAYVHGVWPGERTYSQKPLPVDSSLAGSAFKQAAIKFYPEDGGEAYQDRGSQRPYRSFVVMPVPYRYHNTQPVGVLCIDCADERTPFRDPFGLRLLAILANMIYEARMIARGRLAN